METDKLYIQMFSLHGLIRSDKLEMGRDADTGGQIKYVLEEGLELSKNPEVGRVDLFTRRINDKTVSDDYNRPIEEVTDKFRIVRISCGGQKYIRKELLWKYLDEYIDKSVQFIKRQGRLPDLVHGHYADAGYVAMWMSRLFGVPFIFTGHSLGRSKLQKLLHDGMTQEKINRRYAIDHRIEVEEEVLKSADMVITSTNQEVEEQYGQYENRNGPDYRVIPPGLDLEKFYPYYHSLLPEAKADEEVLHAHASILRELGRFFKTGEKPLVMALCRPDKRKNISGLIQAFGEDRELQAMANLAIYAGIRKDITKMEDNEQGVLTDMLLLMDKYDLYGKMAIPKRHDFQVEVPELYRIAAETKGVFVNAALTEPFGLTLLEASATGLPLVATDDGGPRDILANCKNGRLVDPTNTKAIAAAIKSIISDTDLWEKYSKNGILNVRKHYTWVTHAKQYLTEIHRVIGQNVPAKTDDSAPSAIGRRLAKLDHFLITDIDNTLIGEDNSRLPELVAFLREHRKQIGFGIATGRSVESAVEILTEYDLPEPDLMITSVGSEIYYGAARHEDQGWRAHLSNQWDREKIYSLLTGLEFLEYQAPENQREFKLSYNMDPGKDRLTEVHDLLQKNRCRYTLVYSHEQFLDILPYRASKGKAIRYLSYKWDIPLSQIIVSGDSGNDAEMLRGDLAGVVVGNYSCELEPFRGNRKVYFAESGCAGGILEGIEHYEIRKKISETAS
ncbi:MAG: sucrose-phosphate phosphatase [Verrucomicrobiota bacterium]|jgi:sucrose-phosphate synthase|nr:sucrose-phosphate phosphatase [Verrucomicrobiota bacterium]MDD8046022.1 sucrose-phosphate phosphatase [Verrucomicrobiota bacterium]MDD8050200.1 sucrose-phosphate phosphatase [Verrucomicrobiota bacterium]HCF95856.1 sucrose-phosphate phosphatase [Verrucomicrobiota bacterium]